MKEMSTPSCKYLRYCSKNDDESWGACDQAEKEGGNESDEKDEVISVFGKIILFDFFFQLAI